MTPPPGRTALYRIRGEDNSLLYIGITNCIPVRWNHHTLFQPWWDELRSLTVDWYDTRQEAEAAEIAAVQAEHPKYNKAHVVEPVPGWPVRGHPPRPPQPPVFPSDFAEVDYLRSDDGLIALADLAEYMRTSPRGVERLTRLGKAPQSISGAGLGRRYRAVDVKLWLAGNTRQSTRDPVSSNPVAGPCLASRSLAPAVETLGFREVAFDASTPEGRDEIWDAYVACRNFMIERSAEDAA